jgi:hypothetical protein
MATLNEFFESIPNLRNGNADQYNVLHVAAGIPNCYRLLTFATEIPNDNNIRGRVVDTASFYQARLEGAGVARDVARAKGLILAAVREGMKKAWNLANDHALAAQRENIVAAQYNGAAAADANRILNNDVRPFAAAYTQDYVSDHMTSSLMRLGMGVFVTCGVILVRTEGQHHFVGENKAVSTAIGKQVFGAQFTPPFGLTMEDFEDVAYHKAPHVWVSQEMIDFARNPVTRVRLLAARLAVLIQVVCK